MFSGSRLLSLTVRRIASIVLIAQRIAKCFQVFLWQWGDLHLGICDDVGGFAFGQYLAAFGSEQFVAECHD